MLLMGAIAVLYEIERNDNVSTILICLLLIGIYGLMCITNTIHYLFAFLVFITILCFMARHKKDQTLFCSFLLEVVALLLIVRTMTKKGDIFFYEVFYLLNFAFFYIYLHFLETAQNHPLGKAFLY